MTQHADESKREGGRGAGGGERSLPLIPPSTPWYREPWVWGVMSGPALVVIAGCYTLWLAIASNDGLVADDYYKQGLAINQTLTRDRAAAAAHYEARLMIAPGGERVRILLSGRSLPAELTLKLLHPTRAGLDYAAKLTARGAGVYDGSLALPASGRWHVAIEDGQRTWRLTGEVQLPVDGPLVLGGSADRPAR